MNADAVTVLVIDDNADQLELIREQLSPQYTAIAVRDGLEGYAVACAERPSAIVIDVAMPVVDGWTVLRKLRSNPVTSRIPTIVLTGLEPGAIAADAAHLGVRSVLGKPYRLEALLNAIQTAVASR